MPEPGRRSANRRAGPGGGGRALPAGAPQPPLPPHPRNGGGRTSPRTPRALTRPQAKDEAAAGTDPRPGAALIARCRCRAPHRRPPPAAAPQREAPPRPGPVSPFPVLPPPPAAQMAPYLFSSPCRPSLPRAAGASHMGGIRAGLS